MKVRALTDIFPAYYAGALTETEVERMTTAHIRHAQTADDITEWIAREDCPYRREALASGMFITISRLTTTDDEDERIHLPIDIREHVEYRLGTIIRRAQTDQLADEMLLAEGIAGSTVAPTHVDERIDRMSSQINYLAEEVADIRAILKSRPAEEPLVWPTYTATATDEQKHVFEAHLKKLCASDVRSMSADVKRYLDMKAREGLIIRPTSINEEYRLLQCFGYPRSRQNYYAALI